MRPTREGWGFLVLLVGLTLAAFNTGNNLLYVVLSLLLSTLFLQNVLAEWNLRWVKVERRLPVELFAYEGGMGQMVLRNTRQRFAAFGIHVAETGGEGGALFGLVPAGEAVPAACAWTFNARGRQSLCEVEVYSDFPFGLFRRSRVFDLPAEVIVFPPRRAGPSARAETGRSGREDDRSSRPGGGGDFIGLRPYVPGDPVRSVHWPNSARFGVPVVVLRQRDALREVVVKVDGQPERLENEIARACGQVVRHLSWGHAVGMELPGERLDPAQGPEHRRRLLHRLALFGVDA